MEKETQYIDITPTWEQSVPSLILCLTHGSDQARQVAYEEIVRMAKLADRHMAFLKMEVQ